MRKHPLLIVWLIANTLSVALPGFSAEPPARHPSPLEGVMALDKLVTYTETKIPLGELVRKVAADTGAPLSAAPEVADEPVAVVVKELPARELLEQLADLLDYRWMREGKPEAPRYEVYQDVASKRNEEALRQAAFAGVEKRLRESVAETVEVASLPPAEIQRQAEEHRQWAERFYKLPYAQRLAALEKEGARMKRPGLASRLASPVNRSLALLLGRLSPQQWAFLREGRSLVFSTDPHPGELLLPEEMASAFRSARPDMDSSWRFGDAEMAEQERRRQRELEAQWAAATGYQATLRLNSGHLQRDGWLSLETSAKPLGAGKPTGTSSFEQAEGTSLGFSAESVDPHDREQENTPERRAALEKDPVFGARKPFKPEAKSKPGPEGLDRKWPFLQGILLDLARTYGIQLISDSYAMDRMAVGFTSDEPIALYVLLDRMTRDTYRWDHHGKLVRFRYRAWPFARRREVPLRLIRRWQDLLERNGALPLEEYLTAATTLNDGQLESADGSVHLRQPVYLRIYPSRHALRLYASLTPAQQQALWQGQTIPAAAMTPAQRALFLAPLQEQNQEGDAASSPAPAISPEAGFTLKSEHFLRVVEPHEGGFIIRPEPVGAPSPTAPAVPPRASPPAARPDAVTRHPITTITFQFLYSQETQPSIPLEVASRS